MIRTILTVLFAILGIAFIFGVFGCMFWLGLAALDLFLKIMMPIILAVLIVGFILYLIGTI